MLSERELPAMVVTYRANGKSRLPEPVRSELALAMLGDVLTACAAVAPTTLVTDDHDAADLAAELGATVETDPGGGQGAASRASRAPGAGDRAPAACPGGGDRSAGRGAPR